MPIATETLGLAGEYAVASEFCRRGVYCQLTLGNRKKTDLLVDAKDQMFRVSVKAKQKQAWPNVRGIWQTGDILVFVDYKNKNFEEQPDFYVLDVPDWIKVVKAIKKQKNDPRAQLNEENTLVWPPTEGKKDGWRGCQVSVNDIRKYKDKWPKLEMPADMEASDA